MPKVTIPNPEPGFTCAIRLLEEARDLIQEAIDNHIFDRDSGERPGPECQYARMVRDIDAVLRFHPPAAVRPSP